MNLQDELSRNARLSGEVAEQKISEKKRREQEEAERIALGITASIKATLLENVRQGKYIKQYNKGTAECYFDIPQNRYLKLNGEISYNRKHVCTEAKYQFLIKKEYAVEFEYLRNILITWGNANQVTVSWVVRENGYGSGHPFPSYEFHHAPPLDFKHRYQLSVKAVTHFPVDPNFPIDYMSAEDIADQEKKEQSRIEYKKKQCATKKKDLIVQCILATLFASLAVVFFAAESYGWMLLELVICIAFGSVAHSSYAEYRATKESLENEISNE